MKIAVLGDIHGNIEALRAAYEAAVSGGGVDKIYHLGDLGGYAPFVNEVVADVMIYGHTHKPYRKDLGGKVFINVGSTGKPKDGDPRACVTIVEITEDEVSTEFLRIPYDVEKTASAIVSSGLPEYFAAKLRRAE